MNRILFFTLTGILLAGSVWAYQKGAVRSHYNDEAFGYALDIPKFPGLGEQAGGMVTFGGPPEAGFASNLNVQAQTIATTRKGYREISEKGMKALSLKVNEDRDVTVSGREAIRYDYEGMMNGKALHFLALAVIEKDRVILFTATASAESFSKVAPEFRASLDSVRLRPEIRP